MASKATGLTIRKLIQDMTQAALERARAIERPTREAMLQRAPEVGQFWHDNQELFKDAWKEWEQTNSTALDNSVYDSRLRAAVEGAWNDPATEGAVKDVWEEVFPGVYKTQFFDPDRLSVLRSYMDNVADAGIPLRPPYGISLHRGGAMLDPRSEGHLGAPAFQTFYRDGYLHAADLTALVPGCYGLRCADLWLFDSVAGEQGHIPTPAFGRIIGHAEHQPQSAW